MSPVASFMASSLASPGGPVGVSPRPPIAWPAAVGVAVPAGGAGGCGPGAVGFHGDDILARLSSGAELRKTQKTVG